MRATVNVAADITGMAFGISRSRHDANPAALSVTLRTPQCAPNVRTRTGFCDSPAPAFGVANRFTNVFIGMIGHCLRFLNR